MIEQQTFAALAEEHMDMVYRIALHALGSPQDADDVTQEVFLRLMFHYSTVLTDGAQLTDGGYTVALTLTDLIEQTDLSLPAGTVQAGAWSLSIPLSAAIDAPAVTIDRLQVYLEIPETPDASAQSPDASASGTYTLTQLQVTAAGVHFYADREVPAARAVLTDGTVVFGGRFSGFTGDGRFYCSTQWPVPLDVADIAALRIGETDIPLS